MTFASQLARTQAASRFVERSLAARPEHAAALEAGADSAWTREAMLAALAGIDDPEALATALRRLRQNVMLRTIHRDINGLATLDEVMRTVSDLAEIAVGAALDLHTARLATKHGRPAGLAGPAPLWVVGMGKLGGHELNVSSDIDLIFVYPDDGETPGDADGRNCISHHEFFARLGKAVIAALDEVTAEGRVFRVDMRLRPFGDSGPLVTSLDSLEHYFITSARPWERYAWLKARVLGAADSAALDDLVRPFVYRKYHDYGMIQDLRDLHANIRTEANRRNRLDDIKVGAGGIREVEFIAQLQQLIRGGRDRALQTRSTRDALTQLGALNLMAPDHVEKLESAYAFLRNLEHRLQYLDDAQTQALPVATDDQTRIAAAMNFGSWVECLAALDQHRAFVTETFNNLFAAEPGAASAAESGGPAPLLPSLWQDSADAPDEALAALTSAGFNPATSSDLVRRLAVWRQSARFRFLTEKARGKLERLIPLALAAAAKETEALAAGQRLLDVLEAVDRRDAYLSLLIENPGVLRRAARLAAKSAWAAGLLQRHPILLDELVKNRKADARADWSAERAWLSRELAAASDDVERHYELLRHFKQIHTLRLNIADVDGAVDVMTLADELSALADLLLDTALALAWRALRRAPAEAGLAGPPAFAIVGYGKLGSKELGYASDLDLVFIRDERRDNELDGQTAHRLAQRVNQLLTALTTGGALYETDLRLRPDGESGVMVPTLESFRDYQLSRAWTWEHQALTRARVCAGDAALAQRFEAIRGAILGEPRDSQALSADVLGMREKMRTEHPGTPDASGRCDLKHADGGIVDLEFIVQFLVLRHAHRHASMTRNAGNFNLLALAGELGLIDQALARAAADAYLAFRARQHLARNNNEAKTLIDEAELVTERAAVRALWKAVFAPGRGKAT
ncbi:MAG: bifunctional [glutamate--ammonia ligase]-adenylyl-L-tyrosine phosphorylase/[glutamate--ammonia-ligase] adenylyltransferase [Betaproteobacteria bacterium]|nr:bifunctional [glutamate--ammonia ligase]-adenylyl-L-tyrosine phosphorylase/[glutamate--ammonia-ligase] adenylyltransferase [Betaproteobacteria bacterium]